MEDISDADIHRILEARQQIAVIWCIEDVQSVRPDLNEDQAWQVLQFASDSHDANWGINWQTLECAAHSLFGSAPEHADAGTENSTSTQGE